MSLNREIEFGKTNASLLEDEVNSGTAGKSVDVRRPARYSTAFDRDLADSRQQILRITHHITRNREEPKTLCKTRSCRAYIHLHSFDGRSASATWLTRIAIIRPPTFFASAFYPQRRSTTRRLDEQILLYQRRRARTES